MDSKTRLETAWSFKEPDRIPIELSLVSIARELPEAKRLAIFEANEADNFHEAPYIDWGFFGLNSKYREEIIEDVPGQYKRIKRIHSTSAGEFYAITRHNYKELNLNDYHWERRYIHTIEELERLAAAPRVTRSFNQTAYEELLNKTGNRGILMLKLHHPLGRLVRWANMEEVYIWMITEKKIFHKFLENSNVQVIESILSLKGRIINPVFVSWALEMLIPPWMSKDSFEEFVFPYDKKVNDTIHTMGGRYRAHCHGNCGQYLERFSEMGIDSLEPLEPPPYGDNDLSEAKKKVGDRMLLSGNILSQDFLELSEDNVRNLVIKAIRHGAPGGGFTLRCTSGNCGTGSTKNVEQMLEFIKKIEVYLDTALKFGEYPIRC
jgi:hypothetical protein